jgi:hypothetical protein
VQETGIKQESQSSQSTDEAVVRDLRVELRASQAERMAAMAEIRQLSLEKVDETRRREHTESLLEAARASNAELRAELAERNADLKAQAERYVERSKMLDEQCSKLEQELAAERNIRVALESSLSWRITAPLRAIKRAIRALSQR